MNLIEALKHQAQIDEEGIMVGVSRQAVDEAVQRIAELEAENERWTLECRELHRTIAKIHEEYRPEVKDAERLEWAKNNPRQFYEICQETLMSNVDENVGIDAAMEETK